MKKALKAPVDIDALVCVADALTYFINTNDLETIRLFTSQLTPKEAIVLKGLLSDGFRADIYKTISPFIRINVDMPDPLYGKFAVGLPTAYSLTLGLLQ